MKHYFYIYACKMDSGARTITMYMDRDYTTFANKVRNANMEAFRCSPLRIKRIL